MMRLLAHALRLALVLSVIAGGALAYFYYRSDDLLRREVLSRLKVILPNATVTLSRANFDLRGRVRLFDLAISLPGQAQPSLQIAETILSIDRQQLTDHQRLIIEEIRLSQPTLRVVRDGQGRFDWQELEFVRPPDLGRLPSWEILHGRVDLAISAPDGLSVLRMPWSETHITAIPGSQKTYRVTAETRTDLTGRMELEGHLPLESGSWSASGHVQQIQVDAEAARLLLAVCPQLVPQWQEWQRRLDHMASSAGPPGMIREVSREVSRKDEAGCSGQVELRGHAEGPSWEQISFWSVQGKILDGQLHHPVLPHEWYGLAGEIHAEPGHVDVRGLTASSGTTRIALEADWVQSGTARLTMKVKSLPINEEILTRLPEALARQIRALRLEGLLSGEGTVEQQSDGTQRIDAELTLENGTVCHEKFPLPVRNVEGAVSWHHDLVQIQAQGIAGTSTVQAFGTVHQPGPACSAAFDIRARDLSSSDEVTAALPPAVAKVARELRFQGRGDIWLRLYRPEGLQQRYRMLLINNVRDASIQFTGFPYPITQLSGRIKWQDDSIAFEQLQGHHDGAMISGQGNYEIAPDGGRLELALHGTNMPFDRALYSALPVSLRNLWDQFSPQGAFDVATSVGWTVGQAVEIDLPRMHILKADFAMKDFPYPFQDLEAELAYSHRDQRVDFRRFSARHDDTQLSGEGTAHCHRDGTVTISLDKFHVDDLTPTPALRRALPRTLRDVVETLNPSGNYSFHGPVKFYGDDRRGGLVGAEWDLQILLAGCALNAGLRIDDIYGRVQLAGNWTPQRTSLQGKIDLDALDVLENHQITGVTGPFRLQDGVLVVGSREMAQTQTSAEGPRITREQRITGQACDGEVTVDAVVDLNGIPTYMAAMEISNASLEKYAVRHLRGHSNVRGLVNGWMEVRGRGVEARGMTGAGQLQISPAALYELPIFLQIFQLPQFAPVNRTAFDYANFSFRIEDERFNFQDIDLVGNTISFKGRGSIRFDGAVILDFFSMRPRNQVRWPGLREIVGMVNMVGQGWVAVEVRGAVHAPVARIVPFPAVDEALQQFLTAFNPRPGAPPPSVWRGAPARAPQGPPPASGGTR